MKKIMCLLLLAIPLICLTCSHSSAEAFAETGQKGSKGDPQTDEPYFFIQMTDIQLGFIDANNSFDADAKLFEQAVGIVNRLKPDFVVITGDHINSSRSQPQMDEFKRILKKFDKSIPVHLIPGNHDISKADNDANVETYIRNYGYDRFGFRHKGSTFVGINSCLIKDNNEMLEASQLKWLEKQLKKGKDDKHRFVFMHHPLFIKTVGEEEKSSNIGEPMRGKYLEMLTSNGVDAVFAGHLHYNAFVEYGDMELVTIGAVGKALGKGFHGMNLVKVYPDRYEYKYIALDDFPESVEF